MAEVGAKLALYMLAARMLSQEECGVLFLCLTWVLLAGTIARLGLERGLSRVIPAELAVRQGETARRALVKGLVIVTLLGLVVGLITMLTAPFAADRLFHAAAALPALRACGLVIPILTLGVSLGFVLVGFHRPVLSQILQNLLWPFFMLAGVMAGFGDAASIMLLMGAAYLVATILSLIAVAAHREELRQDEPLPAEAIKLPSLLKTSLPLYVVELVQVAIPTLPVLILGVFADPAAVSSFSIALRASMLVLVVLLSLSMVASPRFAALHRQGDWVQLAAVNRRTQALGALLGGAVCLVLAAGAPVLLTLIGRNFMGGAPALLVLLAGQAINALYAGQDGMLAMTGQGNALRMLNLVQVAVMLVLSFTLIPMLGAVGAAIVTAAVTAQGAIGTAMAVKTYYPPAAPRLAPAVPGYLRHLFLRLSA
jgi:O-antigen/teichoic acid export membrane protein